MVRSGNLISTRTTTLANTVGVNRRTSATDACANQGALLTTSYPADDSTGSGAAGRRQLVTMLLPEAATVPVTIPDTTGMSVGNVAMPVPQSAALGGHGDFPEHEHNQYCHHGKCFSHSSSLSSKTVPGRESLISMKSKHQFSSSYQ